VRCSSKLACVLVTVVGLILSGCRGFDANHLPAGQPAYQMMPPEDAVTPATEYLIQPRDELSIRVFEEPGLSSDRLVVDDAGKIRLPLAGEIVAKGMSPGQLTDEISRRLRQGYLVRPQVAVSVIKLANQFVTVEGEVTRPGVFEIGPDYSLLSALARAESPNKVAKLDQIVIFRKIDGKRMGARFDLGRIRSGLDPDPRVFGGDVVVVGYSSARGTWQNVLQAAPLLNLFYLIR